MEFLILKLNTIYAHLDFHLYFIFEHFNFGDLFLYIENICIYFKFQEIKKWSK